MKPTEFARPTLIEDRDTANNTDTAANVGVKRQYGRGTYYFLSG